jgi:MOSC domain-containing protein YiiM
MGTSRVLTVNAVHTLRRGYRRTTAIDKRPVDGPVDVGPLGIDVDTQCDKRFHGGVDKALYAYASEEATWWSAELGREVAPGYFGENLTTGGLDVDGAVIGEQWRVGGPRRGITVEVRLPRYPCSNLAARVGVPRFHHRFDEHGRPGAYLAVREAGQVRAGDPVTVVERPDHGVRIRDVALGLSTEQATALLGSGVDLAAPLQRYAVRTADPSRRRRQ